MRCPLCPYYEQKTSYRTEIVKCKNTDCPYKAEKGGGECQKPKSIE